MKILTMFHAETTTENFGKRGMSVFGTSVLVLITAWLSEVFRSTAGLSSATGRELPTQQFFSIMS